MRIFDISMPIHPDMPVYKDREEKRPQFTITADHPSHGVRETRIGLDLHTGTHIDAPLHMVEDGAGVEAYRLADLITSCKVLDLTSVTEAIRREDLQHLAIGAGDFVLFKTRNSQRPDFDFNFVYLAADAARYLAELGIKGVGFDALGIERNQPGHETHKILFAKEIIIIEGLRLGPVPPGEYRLIAAPLAIQGVEAAPARVLLIQD